MNRKIKEIVQMHNIEDLREEYIMDKEFVYKLERKLARLSFNHKVGKYVNMRDRYDDLIMKMETAKGKRKDYYRNEIQALGIELKKLRDGNQDIEDYLDIERDYVSLKETLGEYHRVINEDFRNEFNSYEAPNIFIYQGTIANLEVAHNIILPEIKEVYEETRDIIIYPPYELTSNREYRHFYNKVSFKYLEALTSDYSFDLENKKIGKVRVKKY